MQIDIEIRIKNITEIILIKLQVFEKYDIIVLVAFLSLTLQNV